MTGEEQGTGHSETVIYRARLHWAIFLGPIALFLVAVFNIPTKGLPAYIITALAVLWLLISYRRFNRFQIALTATSIIVRSGLFGKGAMEIPIADVASADTYQPSLGALLNFGKVMVVRKKGGRHTFRLVAAPLAFIIKLKESAAGLGQ
jgi:hypothetical protein